MQKSRRSEFIKYLHDNYFMKGKELSLSIFMQEALINDDFGYYQNANPFGKVGDFITAPEVSEVFGELIGLWAGLMLSEFKTDKITLIEAGAGRAKLMYPCLRVIKKIFPEIYNRLDIIILEKSKLLEGIQKDILAIHGDKISWIKDLDELKNLNTGSLLFLANEFLDALGIDQFMKTKDGFMKKFIKTDDNNQFIEIWQDYDINNLDNLCYLPQAFYTAREGDIVELSLAVQTVMLQLINLVKLKGGAGLLIDYGYTSAGVGSTLQSVREHCKVDLLKNIPYADITAHVDFYGLASWLQSEDLRVKILEQGEFLLRLGIQTRMQKIMDILESIEQRQSLFDSYGMLTNFDKMGKLFKVLSFTNVGVIPIL